MILFWMENKIAEVQDCIYLGSLVSAKGSNEKEIKMRLAMARNATQKVANIWRNRGINNCLNLKIALTSIYFPLFRKWDMGHDQKRFFKRE